MPDDRELENLLNSALSSYAEPDAHLETRVLARIAEHRSTRANHRRLAWAFALPIAACTILLTLFVLPHRHQQPAQQAHNTVASPQPQSIQQRETTPVPSNPPQQPKPRLVAAHTQQRTAPKAAPLPKLDIFPTPRPLSPEEQALVRFVATAPASERNAALAAQQQSNEPLHIAEIVIQPIASTDKPETEQNR